MELAAVKGVSLFQIVETHPPIALKFDIQHIEDFRSLDIGSKSHVIDPVALESDFRS